MPFASDVALPSHQFLTDACLMGGGAAFGSDWFYVSWEVDMPEISKSHINVLELTTVLVAAERWGPQWYGKHIVVRSDNSATVASINKGTSRSVDLLGLVQKLFWLSIKYSFKLTASFLPGKLNILSDRISRMHAPIPASEAQGYLCNINEDCLEVCGHMTKATFVWLQAFWEMSWNL